MPQRKRSPYPGVRQRGARRWQIVYTVPGLGETMDRRRGDGSWDNRYHEEVHAETKRAAFDLRMQRIREVELGTWQPRHLRNVPSTADQPLSFGGLVERFLATYRPRSGSIEFYRERCRALLRHIRPELPAELPLDAIDRFVRVRAEEVGASTLRKDVRTLGTIYRWALRRRLVQGNPLDEGDAVQVPAEPPAKTEYLNDQEFALLLSAARDCVRRYVRWAVGTGMDRAEIVELRWSQIDRVAGVVHAPRSKTRRARTLPLNDELLEVLAECERVRSADRNGRAFLTDDGVPWTVPGVTSALRRTYDKAGLSDRAPSKVLRHTFGTRLRLAGVDIATIQELMGHASVVTTSRYAHAGPTTHREAMQRLTWKPPADERNEDEVDRQGRFVRQAYVQI